MGKKKKTNNQANKDRQKETNINKQISIEIKPELSQWRPVASPSPFPIFLNNIHSYNIITTCPTFLKYGRPRLVSSFSKVHWTISKLLPTFWDSCDLSLCYAGLQGSKVYYWAVEQMNLSNIYFFFPLLETYLLSAVLCPNVLVTIRSVQHCGASREPEVALN